MRCARGPNLPGLMGAGGMAELFKTTARAVVKLPAGTEPAHVAALADAGLTAYHAVRKAVPALGPGSSAVAVGAGGLGHIGIQCLTAMTAAQVIAVDTSEDALKLALSCGADHAVTADGQQAQQVRDLTGTGANAVFDFVGEDTTIGDSVAMLRPGGTYYLIGYGGTVTLPAIQLVLGEITVAGNLIGTNPDLTELVRLASQGKVTLHSASYPLEAANDAIDDLRHGRIRAGPSSFPAEPAAHNRSALMRRILLPERIPGRHLAPGMRPGPRSIPRKEHQCAVQSGMPRHRPPP